MNKENNKCKHCGQELETLGITTKCPNTDCPSKKKQEEIDQNQSHFPGGIGGGMSVAMVICETCGKMTEYTTPEPPKHDCFEHHIASDHPQNSKRDCLLCSIEKNPEAKCGSCEKPFSEPAGKSTRFKDQDCYDKKLHELYPRLKQRLDKSTSQSQFSQGLKGSSSSENGNNGKTSCWKVGGIIALTAGVVGGILWYLSKRSKDKDEEIDDETE